MENAQDKGTETNTNQGGETKIDPAEFQNLKSSYDNLNTLLGKQGNELGQLRQQVAQYEQEKETASLKAAESGKVKELETALQNVNSQIAELDVTDPDYNKTLAKLNSEAFKLAEQKGREETLALAKDSFSKELSKRDQMQEERKVQKVIERFHKDNPDFKQLHESGALDPIIKESEGFHDPVSAFWKMKHDQLAAKATEMEKRLKLAGGEGQTGTVITSTGQEINVNPKEKLGNDRLDPRKVDDGMRAALRGLRGGAG